MSSDIRGMSPAALRRSACGSRNEPDVVSSVRHSDEIKRLQLITSPTERPDSFAMSARDRSSVR
jgi:hypothetical protein